MEETIEKYDPLKLENIRRFLESRSAKGMPRYFEIYVDGLKVIERTNDPAEFDNHEEFLHDGSKEVKVLLYTHSPTSPKVISRHIFRLQGESLSRSQELSGLDIDNRINEKVSQAREKWDTDLMKKELDQAQFKLKEADEYIAKLQDQLEHYKSKKLHIGDVNIGEFGSILLEGIIRRNPQMLAKLPGGEALAGVIEQDNKEREAAVPAQKEGAVTATRLSPETELSEDQKRHLAILKEMEDNFDEDNMYKVMLIINCFIQNKSQIETVADLLNIKKKSSQ